MNLTWAVVFFLKKDLVLKEVNTNSKIVFIKHSAQINEYTWYHKPITVHDLSDF